MKIWVSLLVLIIDGLCCTFAQAAPPAPEPPTKATVEALVNGYVDHDFIYEQLPPPPQCEQYAEKLLFTYDWQVILNTIGPYDSAQQQLPVTATILTRCGPVQPKPSSEGEATPAAFPFQMETPIDFQLTVAPEQGKTWAVHDVTLWKSKQRVKAP